MDMSKFTSAMLDVIEHCATEAQIDVEWRSVSVGDMRDAYDLLTRKLARDGVDPDLAKGTLISMALERPPRSLRLPCRINVQHDPGDFAPVGAFGIRI